MNPLQITKLRREVMKRNQPQELFPRITVEVGRII
jgi:hypothetical protein